MCSKGSARDYVAQAADVIPQPVVGAAKGEPVPGNGRSVKFCRFETLVIDAEHAADGRGRVDDNDGRTTGIGVDIDEAIEANIACTCPPSRSVTAGAPPR